MEERDQILCNYARYLELEGSIPELEAQRKELLPEVRERKLDCDWKELELKNREKPGFFQRLLGNAEEKKEKAYFEYREALAAWEEGKRELAALEARLEEEGKQLQSLKESKAAYDRVSGDYTAEQKIDVFGTAAVQAANRCIEALENARKWMRQDAVRKGVRADNRKMEFLALAEKNARQLKVILELIGMESVPVGTYLNYPDSYITNVTSEFKQLDRLEAAQNQVCACRDAIRSRI